MPFKPLLPQRVFGDNEVLGPKVFLILGWREVVVVLGVVEVLRVILVLMFVQAIELLFVGDMVAEVLHTIQGVVFFGGRVAFPAIAPLGSSALTLVFGQLLDSLITVLTVGVVAVFPSGAIALIIGSVHHIDVVGGGGPVVGGVVAV